MALATPRANSCNSGMNIRVNPASVVLSVLLVTGAASGQAPPDAGIRSVEPDDATGTAKAVVVGRTPLAHTAQLLPLDAKGELVGKGDISRQAGQVLDNLDTALKEAGSGFDRLVKINVSAARTEAVAEVEKVLARRFNGPAKPAVSFVVGQLAHPDALVAMDAVAAAADPGGKTVKRLASAALSGKRGTAHVAVLPTGEAVYISGQAEKGDLAEATRATLQSLHATLAHFGLNRSHVVQLKAFLRPMTDVRVVEAEVARAYDGQTAPPMVYVEWLSSLPIEIELIAAAGGSPAAPAAATVTFFTPPGMKASPVYSRVARAHHGQRIYLSGLYGTRSGDGEAQIREIFASLQPLLHKTGSDLRHLVKATYYVSDDVADRKLNEIRPEFYDPQRPPAASKARVAGVGRAGQSITMDLIAVPSR